VQPQVGCKKCVVVDAQQDTTRQYCYILKKTSDIAVITA